MLVFGNKGFTARTIKFWREDTSKPKKVNKKTGNLEHPRVPTYIRRIWVEILTPKGDGLVWCFVGMKRKGEVRWTDGRKVVMDLATVANEKPYNDASLRTEIARMTTGNFADQIFAALEMEVNGEEHADMIGAHFVPTYGVRAVKELTESDTGRQYMKTIGFEDYEGRELEGGYIDRVNAAIEAVKSRRRDKVVVNKRR